MVKRSETQGEVVPVTSAQIVAAGGAQLPDYMAADIDEFAGAGNSKDAADSALPFLGLLQTGSPQVKEEDPKYILGAKAGYLLNSASKQVWPARAGKSEEGVVVVPCFYTKKWVEWKPNRGGFVANHYFDISLLKKLSARKVKVVVEGKEKEQITLPNDNYLVETAYTFVLAGGSPLVIGAASSALGPMRDWMYARKAKRYRGRELPSFACQWRLQTVLTTRGENSWYNWKITDTETLAGPEEYALGKALFQAASTGTLQIGRPDYFDDDGVGEEAARNSRAPADGEDDSIPV